MSPSFEGRQIMLILKVANQCLSK